MQRNKFLDDIIMQRQKVEHYSEFKGNEQIEWTHTYRLYMYLYECINIGLYIHMQIFTWTAK